MWLNSRCSQIVKRVEWNAVLVQSFLIWASSDCQDNPLRSAIETIWILEQSCWLLFNILFSFFLFKWWHGGMSVCLREKGYFSTFLYNHTLGIYIKDNKSFSSYAMKLKYQYWLSGHSEYTGDYRVWSTIVPWEFPLIVSKVISIKPTGFTDSLNKSELPVSNQ